MFDLLGDREPGRDFDIHAEKSLVKESSEHRATAYLFLSGTAPTLIHS
jgi:hypothetical protein